MADTSIVLQMNESAALQITQDEEFDIPIQITVRKRLSNFDIEGPVMFQAIPFSILGKKIENPTIMAKEYVRNYVCVYDKQQLIPILAKNNLCSQNIVSGDGREYSVKFSKMKWIKPTKQTSFRLTVSTPLNYIRITDTSSSVYEEFLKSLEDSETSTSSSAETRTITVTNSPSELEISLQPQKVVYVGDYFQAAVICRIKSGAIIKG